MLSDHALLRTADSLERISASNPGERGRRAASVAVVLRSLQPAIEARGSADFLRRRAAREVEGMSADVERALLARLLLLLDRLPGEAAERGIAATLLDLSCELERTGRLPEADAVVELARCIDGEDATLALHAGRIARKHGDRERALALYRAARDLDGEGGCVGRLASVGEAVVSPAAEAALGRVIAAAVRCGDSEAAAVGREERARLRRARGARGGAARDLCAAALRFSDPVDRARVAHRLADLYVAGGDPRAAREALLFALEVGDARQRDHARSRLHTVARDLGDRVGMRRWRASGRPALVSLSSRPGATVGRSAAPRLARWRERVVAALSSPA